MKSKNRSRQKSSSIGPLEIALLPLPFLALTPNFFIAPDLSYLGLATQELAFALALATIAAVGLLRAVRARGSSFNLNRDHLLMLVALVAFIIWQLLTLSWAPTPYDGLRVAGIWTGFGVFFGAGLLFLQKRLARWLHYSLTAVCLILAVSIVIEYSTYGSEMMGVFFNHGISAELLALLLPMQILNYLCSEERGLTIGSFAVTGLSSMALFLGMRRGPLLGTVVVLIVIAFALLFKLVTLQSKQRLVIILALLVMAATAVGLRYRNQVVFRFRGAVQLQSVQGATQATSIEGGLTSRLRVWITAWEMGKRNTFIGVGNAGYSSLYGSYRRHLVSNPQYAQVAELAGAEDHDEIHSPLVHNEYLQIFVELGIVGLLLFIVFWAQVIWRLWQRLKQTHDHWILGALLGLIAFGISSGASAFSLRYTPGAFILAAVLAIGFAFSKRDLAHSGTTEEHLAIPKIAVILANSILLIACLLFLGRTYLVYSSQKLQGWAPLKQEQLDFVFYPNNVAGNEGLQRRYGRALELDPANVGAHLGYGLLLFQLKKIEDAIPHIEYAHKNGYSRPFTYILLAFANEQKGDMAKASEILRDCVASFPQSIYARASYAEILRKEGKLDQMREQQNAMYSQDKPLAHSLELALRMKRDDAVSEAKRRGLPQPDRLKPKLVSTLINMRAYHYLK
ncbi:MAG: O-antigen ligase family protein [Acidobacteria bacterium]|nr:O-antigen ligase family protein [Acidobacteriota bacterium]